MATAFGLPSMASLGRNAGHLNREARRLQVLQKYTASENFPVLSSIISVEVELSESDRARMKMSRLAIPVEGESLLHSTQVELITVMESMDSELKSLWAVGDRVRALRIAIQAIKLLGHTKVPQCYPSLFILMATVLDTFGDLVADRIQETACQLSPLIAQLIARGQQPDPSIIPPAAVEMCNNWFLKILSIRELLPRVYVELSLMRTYRYVAKKFRIESMRAVVERLAMQVRGVADPLVAVHARWYVCLRAAEVLRDDPHWGESMILCCKDTLQLVARLPPASYESKGMLRAHYVALFKPALQWLFDVVATHSAPTEAEQFCEVTLRMCELDPNVRYSSILSVIVNAFDTSFIMARLDRILAFVTSPESNLIYDGTPRLEIITNVCHVVAETPAPLAMPKSQRMALINTLWEHVQIDSGNFVGFMAAAGALLRVLHRHASASQTAVLLSAIADHCRESNNADREAAEAQKSPVKPGDAASARVSSRSSWQQQEAATRRRGTASADKATAAYNFLAVAIQTLPSEVILTSWTAVAPMLHMLSAAHRDACARALLSNAPATHRFSSTIAELCRQVHDGLSDRTSRELVVATSSAVCKAIRQCFTTDVPQQLRFMCECRHGLPLLDEVKITLVQEGIRLAQSAVAASATAGNASAIKAKRNTAKACFAFCHVTAPGIADAPARLLSCLNSAAVAFHEGFVAQAEALLQLAVAGLSDVTLSSPQPDGTIKFRTYGSIASLAIQILNVSSAAPPHAKYGHLYCFVSVLAWASTFTWPAGSEWPWRVACAALALVGALRSGCLPLCFAHCPKPTLLAQDEAFGPAAVAVARQAVVMIRDHEHREADHLRLSCTVVESASRLVAADPSAPCAALLQRSLKALVAALSTPAANESEGARIRDALDWAKRSLGEDAVAAFLDGEEIPECLEEEEEEDVAAEAPAAADS